MATTIKWIDNNVIETAHRIYKSSTYFNTDSLPTVLVELGPDVTEWVDPDGVDGENWYIVSALLNDYEVFSEPFIVGINTINTHDIFADGSAVATYTFNNTLSDLGGLYDGYIITGTELYLPFINNGFSFNGATELRMDINVPFNSIAYSFWSTSLSNSIQLIVESDVVGELMLHTNSTGFRFGAGQQVDFQVDDKSGINHWVIMWDGVNASLHKNGVLVSEIPCAGDAITPNFIRFGRRSTYFLSASIDQFRIFNRTLTQQEVNKLYIEGAIFL